MTRIDNVEGRAVILQRGGDPGGEVAGDAVSGIATLVGSYRRCHPWPCGM